MVNLDRNFTIRDNQQIVQGGKNPSSRFRNIVQCRTQMRQLSECHTGYQIHHSTPPGSDSQSIHLSIYPSSLVRTPQRSTHTYNHSIIIKQDHAPIAPLLLLLLLCGCSARGGFQCRPVCPAQPPPPCVCADQLDQLESVGAAVQELSVQLRCDHVADHVPEVAYEYEDSTLGGVVYEVGGVV